MKKCCTCNQIRKYDDFGKDINTNDGFKKRCKKCREIEYKKYRASVKEKKEKSY